MTIATTDIRRLVENCLTDAYFAELPGFERGKVRDSYDLPDGRRIMITTDRQSAFDQVLAAVPYKGQVLTETARYWFARTEDICANHVLADPAPNVSVVRRLRMLPVEMVVRDYLTGSTETSIWPMYAKGKREMYGVRFPDGLTKNAKLPATVLTPTTKAAQGTHDEPLSPRTAVERALVTEKEWDHLADLSMRLFARGREIAAMKGLILVDTKYEFGLDPDGRIALADEVHTPDSSRYWIAASYEERMRNGREPDSLDKEFLRLWIKSRCDPYHEPIPEIPRETLAEFSEKYIRLYEQVTGLDFERPPLDEPVRERVRASLARTFPEYFSK